MLDGKAIYNLVIART